MVFWIYFIIKNGSRQLLRGVIFCGSRFYHPADLPVARHDLKKTLYLKKYFMLISNKLSLFLLDI
jgi:hypothetical protein